MTGGIRSPFVAGFWLEHLVLQTGFVTAIGLLTFYASRSWQREHQTLSVETRALSGRLRDLESELEDARTLGQVGEGVARLAHGLKIRCTACAVSQN